MKRVINWTFGAFFRSIGRTLALLFIGTIIAFILLKSGFKLPRLFPIMQVNAEVIYNATDNPTNLRSAVRGHNFSSTGPDYQGYYSSTGGTAADFTSSDVILDNDNINDCNNGIMRNLGIGGYKTDYLLTCGTPVAGHDMAMFNHIEFYFGSNPLSTYEIMPKNYNYRLNILVASGPSIDISSDGWYWRSPYVLQNAVYKGKYNGFELQKSYGFKLKKTNNGGNLTWLSLSYDNSGSLLSNKYSRWGIGFSLFVPLEQYIFNSDPSIKSYGQKEWFYILDYKLEKVTSTDYNFDDTILTFDYPNVKNNIWQTEEYVYSNDSGSGDNPVEPPETTNEDINNSINDMNDSINNDNIDDANNDASSFFEGFESEDNGGLSGIITAPLNSINAMLSDSCSPLTTSFRGKEIKLPCGTEFYNSMGEVRTFLNMLEGGFLSYMILRKLYFLIQKLKNPEDDRVEVMSL